MSLKDDWRYDGLAHLRGVSLKFQKYIQYREGWDHDHCAGCWGKFSTHDIPDVFHEGWTTDDSYVYGAWYEWICKECWADFREEMGWECKD